MAGKITDARMEQLKLLDNRIQDLKQRQEKELAELEVLLSSMTKESKDSLSSTTKAVREKRGKAGPEFNHQDVIDMQRMVIDRLGEELARAQDELEGLQQLMENA